MAGDLLSPPFTKSNRKLDLVSFSRDHWSVNEAKELKKRERALLVAQLVYQEAITRHRAERSEVTQRMVTEAQEHLARVRRHAMLASWGTPEPPLVTCPNCGDAPRSTTWSQAGADAETDASVPDWAARWARQGVDSVTRYHCDRCDFEIAMLT
jgi:hypothetical protein